jgi:hypothetical protein
LSGTCSAFLHSKYTNCHLREQFRSESIRAEMGRQFMLTVHAIVGALGAVVGGAALAVPVGLVLSNGASLLWLVPAVALVAIAAVVCFGLMFAPP